MRRLFVREDAVVATITGDAYWIARAGLIVEGTRDALSGFKSSDLMSRRVERDERTDATC